MLTLQSKNKLSLTICYGVFRKKVKRKSIIEEAIDFVKRKGKKKKKKSKKNKGKISDDDDSSENESEESSMEVEVRKSR